ncbi:MAG TPA: hypothetical protein VNJ11_15465 [Bryobacteraceae bacterium]|nr:hypothetical protein [Bryobacteraceae bacterium]
MIRPDWQRIGGLAVEAGLGSPAGGPVERVWFTENGTVVIRTASGRYFSTANFGKWAPLDRFEEPPPDASPIKFSPRDPTRLYAAGADVYRSDDGGRHWTNLTRLRRRSILGAEVRDLAVSPENPDQLIAVNDYGVWMSLDGGLSWVGLNQSLPNLPAKRLLAPPEGMRGARVWLEPGGAAEWFPGEKEVWNPAPVPEEFAAERAVLEAAERQLGVEISAIGLGREHYYAGARDGRIWVSLDRGGSWRLVRLAGPGAVRAIAVSAVSEVAAAGLDADQGGSRVLLTVNGGISWQDITGDLPAGRVSGLAIDRESGAVYAATDAGVFLAFAGVLGALPPSGWMPLTANLPAARALDVRLDASGNQVYIVLEGYGVYYAPAPHRFRDVRVVSVADYRERPAAPGALLSVLGARLLRARAGVLNVPVLYATDTESHIQIPFGVSGEATLLDLESPSRRLTIPVPLEPAAPAIFVDPSGTPLLLDGASGTLLDASTPARSGGRVQVLATGLGKVVPDWEAGVAAPSDAPPRVAATVRAFLDRQPVEVLRAVLAPGYTGFYMVEIQLPAITAYGPAELYLEVGGKESNRVRIYLEP